MDLDEAAVYSDVSVDHPRHSEPSDGALAHTPPVQIEHAWQFVRHLLEILEDDTGHTIVDHFTDRAFVERGDRRSARHGFGEDEAERLTCLDRVQERPRASVQLDLCVKVGLA